MTLYWTIYIAGTVIVFILGTLLSYIERYHVRKYPVEKGEASLNALTDGFLYAICWPIILFMCVFLYIAISVEERVVGTVIPYFAEALMELVGEERVKSWIRGDWLD